jgi:ABC-type antimicrobial peptide transport system permease subunit
VFIEMGVDAGGDDWDHRIVVPLTTTTRRLFGRPYLEQIVMLAGDASLTGETAERVRELLRVRHGIKPGMPDDFFVREPAHVEGAAIETSSTATTLAFAIALAALIAVGVVIMNVMLVAVGQREREIALRRAVGARIADIERMVIAEALIVAIIGGAIGVVLGAVAGKGLELAGVASARVTWMPFVAAALACAALGLVFGRQPARKAAGVDPSSRLRARHV